MRIQHLLVGLLLGTWPLGADAQGFPSHTVTIVSPYQAGGTSDIIARVLAQKLSERWGHSVVVENRPGANGGIGVNQVIRAPADGHTILAVASSVLTINPIFYKNLNYDVARDLAPVTRTGSVANVLVVNMSLPVANVAELVSLARSKQGGLTYASQGTGSNGQVTAELFRLRAGIEYQHIPYKGSAPAMQDLLGGRVDLMFDNLPSALPQIQAGKLRALAVTTASRSSLLPDVPTIAESGLSTFDTSAWFAILAAKAMPDDVRSVLEISIVAVMTSPDVRAQLATAGVDVAADGSGELARRIEAETQMWRNVVTEAKIQVE
jgi:tripartite-type tricarboxylate transporter receptor subunit TctC